MYRIPVSHINLTHRSFFLFPGVTLHTTRTIPSLKGQSYELISRFRERASGKNLLKVLRESLVSVGLDLKDISGITTDGGKNVCSLARKIKQAVAPEPFYHQVCLAHGLHLAVGDALSDQSDSSRASPRTDKEDETTQGDLKDWSFIDDIDAVPGVEG